MRLVSYPKALNTWRPQVETSTAQDFLHHIPTTPVRRGLSTVELGLNLLLTSSVYSRAGIVAVIMLKWEKDHPSSARWLGDSAEIARNQSDLFLLTSTCLFTSRLIHPSLGEDSVLVMRKLLVSVCLLCSFNLFILKPWKPFVAIDLKCWWERGRVHDWKKVKRPFQYKSLSRNFRLWL